MQEERMNSFYVKYGKRYLDICLAVILLVLFWWLFLICGMMVFIDSGCPIIYKQVRFGKGEVPFMIYKFRTMVKNADKIGKLQTAENDPRITRVGRWLRKTSLDELPQIINVLKGDMSFVGFRPDVLKPESSPKYNLRPGITGYAQVNGRSSITAEERKQWEERYVKDVSFITDLKIILKTILVIFDTSKSN